MFRKLMSFFASWFDAQIRFIQRAQAFSAWLWATIAGVICCVLWTINFMTTRTNQLLLWLISLVDTTSGHLGAATSGMTAHGTALSMLEVANTFFPVQELFMVAVSLTVLQGMCSLYGLIKSWIPTVSE